MSTSTPHGPTPRARTPNRIITDPDGPQLHRVADSPSEPLHWLWPGRIPIGSITLLAGDPGVGKSLFALDLAARVTTGAAWPDEKRVQGGGGQAEGKPIHPNPPPFTLPIPPAQLPPANSPGSVLILSASDPLSTTLRPRLDAAGADPARVMVVDNITNLRTQMDRLRVAVETLPDLKLLILDPINFYVGPGDAHFQTVVRSVLQPLSELAQRRGLAVLAITHFRKNDGAALQRAAGSMGFVATARTIWTIVADPAETSRRYLLPVKTNLAAPATPLAFHILPLPPGAGPCEGASAPALHWDPTPAADELASLRATPRSTSRDEAKRFLEQALANGPCPADQLFKEADHRGLTRRTLQRAFHDLAGHTKKVGFSAGWWWSLGDYPIDSDVPFETLLLEEPTYATDVAAQQSFASLTAGFAAEITRRVEDIPKNVSPSAGVSPSAKSRPKSPPPSPPKQSPPRRLSPSTTGQPKNPPSAPDSPSARASSDSAAHPNPSATIPSTHHPTSRNHARPHRPAPPESHSQPPDSARQHQPPQAA